MTYEERYKEYIELIEDGLSTYFPKSPTSQERIFEAMRYSLFGGGKRIRPVILLEFCRVCGGSIEQALPFACALEMIHTYSLIHDDLPCMDNDDLRRGRPTNHKVFGDAIALLAGDALLNGAFECIFSQGELEPSKVLEAAKIIASSSGAFGMIGGQVMDIENENLSPDAMRIKQTYKLKTGALISAAAEVGCAIAGADAVMRKSASVFAHNIGLAFQLVDDLLDIIGEEETVGKTLRSDNKQHKSTFAHIYGLDMCKHLAEVLTESAKTDIIKNIPDSDFLCWFADFLIKRDY